METAADAAGEDSAADAPASGNITAHVDMPAAEEETQPSNTAEVVQLHGGSQPNN